MSDCCKQTSSFYTSDRLTRIEERLAALEGARPHGPNFDTVTGRPVRADCYACMQPLNLTPKTDADLLADLRAELGEGWVSVHKAGSGRDQVHFLHPATDTRGFLHMPSLRTHGAPEIAECLRVLAGVKA